MLFLMYRGVGYRRHSEVYSALQDV